VSRKLASLDDVYTIIVLAAVQMQTYRRMHWPLSMPCFSVPIMTDERYNLAFVSHIYTGWKLWLFPD